MSQLGISNFSTITEAAEAMFTVPNTRARARAPMAEVKNLTVSKLLASEASLQASEALSRHENGSSRYITEVCKVLAPQH